MIALAVMAGGFVLGNAAGAASRLLAWSVIPPAASLVGAGIGYGLLNASLAPLAYIALPLLLLWVAGASIAASLRRQ